MLKKTITYTDFNGEEVSEDFFFHLSKAELIELEMSQEGGLSSWLQKVVAAEDGKSIMEQFKMIILTAYGQKSVDGRRFIKNQDLRDEFASTEAYSVLFVELVTDADAAAVFVNSVIPTDLADEAVKIASMDAKLAAVPDEPAAVVTPTPVIVTKTQVEEMSKDEFVALSPRIASGEVVVEE